MVQQLFAHSTYDCAVHNVLVSCKCLHHRLNPATPFVSLPSLPFLSFPLPPSLAISVIADEKLSSLLVESHTCADMRRRWTLCMMTARRRHRPQKEERKLFLPLAPNVPDRQIGRPRNGHDCDCALVVCPAAAGCSGY